MRLARETKGGVATSGAIEISYCQIDNVNDLVTSTTTETRFLNCSLCLVIKGQLKNITNAWILPTPPHTCTEGKFRPHLEYEHPDLQMLYLNHVSNSIYLLNPDCFSHIIIPDKCIFNFVSRLKCEKTYCPL